MSRVAVPLHKKIAHPLKTYAFLDSRGWAEPGEMGWFGFSSAGTDDYARYADAFFEWFSSGDQDDWVAVVDCHI